MVWTYGTRSKPLPPTQHPLKPPVAQRRQGLTGIAAGDLSRATRADTAIRLPAARPRLRSFLLESVTDEDMQAIAQKLVEQAKVGDLAAMKLLFAYVIGCGGVAVGEGGAQNRATGRAGEEPLAHGLSLRSSSDTFRRKRDEAGRRSRRQRPRGGGQVGVGASHATYIERRCRPSCLTVTKRAKRTRRTVSKRTNGHVAAPSTNGRNGQSRPSANGNNGHSTSSAKGKNGHTAPCANQGDGNPHRQETAKTATPDGWRMSQR